MFDDFLGYLNHQEQIEKVIREGVIAYNNGQEDFTVDITDDFTKSELEYISNRIRKEVCG